MNLRLSCVLVALACSSCATSRQKQLEAVAKDWSLTIRASQVMPVYPLTEDLQPGDVFLVTLPIDQQQRQWKEKGFLPLENHLARLDPDGYAAFYDHSFVTNPKDVLLPASWRAPKASANANEPKPRSWQDAPAAGFPSYSFSVRSSSGLSLAIPVSGVPVGLGVLGSDAADGTISIGKAHTLGVDVMSLAAQLVDWSKKPDVAALLARYQPSNGRTNYLRVVSRIYLSGEVDISLRSAASRGAGLDAGEPKSVASKLVDVPKDSTETADTLVQNYKDALDALNSTLEPASGALPGGSVRFTSVSARSVSMKESFDPPLVIGYVGFDCAIGFAGVLGPPVPSLAAVENTLGPAQLEDLALLAPEEQPTFADEPGFDLVAASWHKTGGGMGGLASFTAWRAQIELSLRVLERALAKREFTFRDAQGRSSTIATPEQRRPLEDAQARLRELLAQARRAEALLRAQFAPATGSDSKPQEKE